MSSDSQNKSVLVVEDDAAARLMTRSTLELANFVVDEAETGEAALKLFAEKHHDVILLDVHLPGLNGFNICQQIRSTPYGKFTPIVMITGVDDIDSIEKAYNIGATDFIIKPVNWTILGHRVHYIIRAQQSFDDLHVSRMRLINAKNVAGIADWEWDIKHQRINWSQELLNLLAVQHIELSNDHRAILEFVAPDDYENVDTALDKLFKEHVNFDLEYKIICPDNSVRYIQENAQVIKDQEGNITSIIGTLQDITNRKLAEEEVKYLAYFDSLTGLPNRASFSEHLDQSLKKAKRNQTNAAVLFLDLDNFKRVNDSLGHSAGDKLLKIVAKRLLSSLRDCDVLGRDHEEFMQPVARLGGDEFTVLLDNNISAENAQKVAARIIKTLNEPVTIDQQEVPLSVSIGIAIYPEDGADTMNLLKNADTAMYHSKEKGKNTFCFYDKKMNELSLKRLHLERDLQKALDNDEFMVLFQPKIDIESQNIIGSEALIRWQHPELGFILPDTFISLAEETNLIVDLGTWILNKACAATKSWHDYGFSDIHVAVNLSARQLQDKNLVTLVKQALLDSGLPDKHLELELTEGMIMENGPETMQQLHELKATGVKLAVDDFGTGYSSLRYLSQFPLDTLKIDKSFVTNLPNNKTEAAITEAIIALAHSLKLSVVAEGVENEAQYEYLKMNKCDVVQGFYFSKPLGAEEMLMRLKQQMP